MKLQTALNNIRNSIRLGTITLMFVGVVVATAAGFAHSYAGLFAWGEAHKLTTWKADTFPLLVDSFILVGELGLFLIALDGLKIRKSLVSWLDILIPSSVIAAGWGASLWFNVNHLKIATTDDKITFAIPPIAAMVGLMILLRTVHRYAARLEDAQAVPAAGAAEPVAQDPAPEPVPATAPRTVLARKVSPAALPIMGTGTYTRTVIKDGRYVLAPAAPAPVQDPAPEPVPAAPVDDDWTIIGTGDQGTAPSTLPEWITSGTLDADPVPAPELDSEPVPAPAAPVSPEPAQPPAPATTAAHSNGTDPRWSKGVAYCTEFHTVTGKLPGQRPLAAHLGMKNRQLAKSILTHVEGMITDGTIKDGLPTAANPAG